jgi:peptidoglycan/LPS O-acetylase OafA/YrhL
MSVSQKSSLPALTGLRYVAAMHVVLYHYLMTVPAYRNHEPQWLKNLLAAAPSSVSLFFVLSGFILTYNYLNRENKLAVSQKEFWGARFARVYPIYFLGILAYLPIALARYFSGTGLTVVDVGPGPAFAISGVLTVLMLQCWTSVFVAWNPPCWSVSVEAFYYATFPRVAPRICSWSQVRRLWTLGILWLLSLTAPFYFQIFIFGHSTRQTKELWERTLDLDPLLRSVPFLMGIAAGVFFLRKRPASHKRMSTLSLLAATVILVTFASTPFTYARPLEYLLPPVFVFLVYLLAFQQGWLARFLGHPKMVLLGEASYSLYMLHNPLWNYFARFQNILLMLIQRHFPVGLAKPGIETEWNYDMTWWTFGLYLVVLTACSILALVYVERPARAYLRRRFAAAPASHIEEKTLAASGTQA